MTNVAVITGTRAEFGIWRPVLHAIAQSPKLALQILVTGTHLLPEFGKTVQFVEASGIPIAANVPMYQAGEPLADGLSRGTANLARSFRELKPHIVLVLGDRLEVLAAASAALCEGLLIGHVHGGETAPGQFDEQIRHAVTKMAHLHFCATDESRRRIVQMGEDPARVHVVGAPALDLAVQAAALFPPRTGPVRPIIVLHPTSRDPQVEYGRTKAVLHAVLANFPRIPGKRIPVVGPNNDPGHEGILRAYREHEADIELQMSVPQETFWTGLASSGLLIGNSSSGIIEAATFRCAVINIGGRQKGRQRSGNVLDVGHSETEIAAAIQRALSDDVFRQHVASGRNVYGDGHASERIVKALEALSPQTFPRAKTFHDLNG